MFLKKLGTTFVFALFMFVAAPKTAAAATLVVLGVETPDSANATGTLTLGVGTFSLSLTNTSPFDARITGIGFDVAAGNANGYTGNSSSGNFAFHDDDLGNVPAGFNSTVLDFGFTTSNNGNFSNGKPTKGIVPGGTVSFMVNGNFTGLTEAQIANAFYVRFQRVGETESSDVGKTTSFCPTGGCVVDDNSITPVPEPASMLLLGTGLVAVARARRKKTN